MVFRHKRFQYFTMVINNRSNNVMYRSNLYRTFKVKVKQQCLLVPGKFHIIYIFSACEATRDYAYFKTSAPNDFIIEDGAQYMPGVTFTKMNWIEGNIANPGWVYRGAPVDNPRKCAVFCSKVPNCVAWSAPGHATHLAASYPEGCKIFSSKAGLTTDTEWWNQGKVYFSEWETSMWMSGERGCYGKTLRTH